MITPMKAIRLQCLECLGIASEVQKCTRPQCSLFPFRFGHRPTAEAMAAWQALQPQKPKHPANKAGILALKKHREEKKRLILKK